MFLKENQQSIVINYNPMTCIQYLLKTIQSKNEHKINEFPAKIWIVCFVVYVIESMDHRFPLNLKEITSIVSLQYNTLMSRFHVGFEIELPLGIQSELYIIQAF